MFIKKVITHHPFKYLFYKIHIQIKIFFSNLQYYLFNYLLLIDIKFVNS